MAAKSFCKQETEVDEAKGTVTTSMIFNWYGADFGATEQERLQFLAKYKEGDESAYAGKALKFSAYNWDVNKK